MASKEKQPPVPLMTPGNMRALGVHHLIGFCHNDACYHQALIDASDCPDSLDIRWFQQRAKCGKCGDRRVDVRPNWKEMTVMPTKPRFD
jgi:hypothetical protein